MSAAGLVLVACSDENPWQHAAGEGGIRLNLQTSADVKDAIPLLRSGAPDFEVPEASDFAISLENLSTGEIKTWDSLNLFNSQTSFATGSYTLTAYYGSADDEGFEKPYFAGSTEVTVLESRQTEAEVTATLANAMVSVEYTDKFKNYFTAWSPTVHSEGHGYITFSQDETRPAFIVPGEVSLTIEVTNPSGKSVTLQPAAFPAAAQHHYHITFDVNQGPTGDNQLQIVFDDSVETEDVTIDLTDELFSSPAPAVTPTGFTDGQVLEALEGSPLSDPARFEVIAKGGLTSAVLTIDGENFTPAFGNEIDLVKASPAQQAQIADLGIKVVGLYKNPDKFAYVDLSNLGTHLPKGKTSVSLVVKDAFTRVSTPVTVHFTNVPVVVAAGDGTAILGDDNATIEVAYNGFEPEKNVSFKALSKAGVYKDCEIVDVKESAATRSFETKNYIFTIKLPDTEHEVIPVKVYFGGEERQSVQVNVTIPEYDVVADAFATYARIKVIPENDSELPAIVNCMRLYNGNSQIDDSSISRNSETGVITLSGLTPATSYSITHSLTAIAARAAGQVSFTTEKASPVENGDFSSVSNTINRSDIEIGGKYSYTVKYQVTANIVRDEADGWASVNAKTCWFDCPGAKNTWFQVPSTYVENGVAVLRNVAYDHNGTKPADMPSGIGKTYWYNTNVPQFTNFAAGELFLGTYSFNGSESRNEGIAFNSRPASVSFDYSYSPEGSDKGEVAIVVKSDDGSVIAQEVLALESASGMKNVVVALHNYPFGKKAAKLELKFRSSNGTAPVHIPQGSELSEGLGMGNFGNKNLGNNNYHAVATGSELKIDNVKLNY